MYNEIVGTDWYAKTIKDIFTMLDSHESGLTPEEATLRLQKYGQNKLPEAKVDSLLTIFLRQFKSPLIYILLIASLIVFAMGEIADGCIILFVLMFNAVIGTIQEGKAQNTLLALKKFAETNAAVIRGGKEMIIPDYEVVPGDIVILQEGEKIPADARIIESNNLMVDEAALTGESEPIHKRTETLKGDNLQTAEQKNMVFKGTTVAAGNGKILVVGTGLDTVFGKISKELAMIDTEIPLQGNIRALSRAIIIVVFSISTSLFILGILLGNSVKEMFKTVVSLAVSIIPEGLPIVMTLILAAGVWRMSKRNALVKKLQAVEALGQARVIAVDKTGTLTKNEIMLQNVFVNGTLFEVNGSGYKPTGEVLLDGEVIDPLNHPGLLYAGKIAALCTNNIVVFDEENKIWRAAGDPTEAAIEVFSQKVGFQKDVLEKETPRLYEIPFDYKNKFHATTHKENGKVIASVIGAPEVILAKCVNIWHNGKSTHLVKEKREELEAILNDMSKKGLRVLAVAALHDAPEKLKAADVKSLTFVGFFGMKDILRPEVHKAMKDATEAGMRVVMITGDHKVTAIAIATEAGIYHEGDTVLSGEDMDNLSEEELAGVIKQVSVFVRVTPEHKLKIVQAYKRSGEIIAMTGDGVNDAPSLVAADLGVSMGKIGTEVAKEASDIVLLDDNFGSIISAIEEGRSIYKTIKKVLLYLFSTSLGEVLTITVALLLGYPLPILAAQIVWLNLVTDGFLTVALAMEPKEEGLLRGTFEHPKKYLLDGLAVRRMIFMATTMMAGTLFLFKDMFEVDMTKALTISLTTLAVYQWFNAWNCRHESKSIFQLNPFSNPFLLGATITVILLQMAAIYTPFMQKILHTAPLNANEWLVIIAAGSFIVAVEEVRKFIYRETHAQ